MFLGKKNQELDKFSELLEKGTIALFKERGEVKFTEVRKKRFKLMEYQGKMRADGMEKFNNEATYVSVVNFYENQQAMDKKKTLGALVVYVEQTYIAKLMKMLKYPAIDDENNDAMRDSCGTLCNIIAGRFKSEISQAGYIELEWSHFTNYRNSAFLGVDFCFNEFDEYEVQFDIEKTKRLVVDLTMGVVPRL